jgi:hypothetical protein
MAITIAPYLQHASNVERRIATAIVRDALAAGYNVSVNDGEEWTLRNSTKQTAILTALGTTDSDTLRLRDADDNIIGSIWLIWGNEDDLLSDHSDNETLNAFVEKGKYH